MRFLCQPFKDSLTHATRWLCRKVVTPVCKISWCCIPTDTRILECSRLDRWKNSSCWHWPSAFSSELFKPGKQIAQVQTKNVRLRRQVETVQWLPRWRKGSEMWKGTLHLREIGVNFCIPGRSGKGVRHADVPEEPSWSVLRVRGRQHQACAHRSSTKPHQPFVFRYYLSFHRRGAKCFSIFQTGRLCLNHHPSVIFLKIHSKTQV